MNNYKVKVKENITGGINEVTVKAGSAEMAEEAAKNFFKEYVDKEDLEIVGLERLDEIPDKMVSIYFSDLSKEKQEEIKNVGLYDETTLDVPLFNLIPQGDSLEGH